jgi:hypothetical protein
MYGLESYRRQIPKAGVQSLLVVDLLYEPSYVLVGFLEVALIFQVNFLQLQCPEEALDLGVLVGIANCGHADPSSCLLQPHDILAGGVSNSPVTVVDKPYSGPARPERHLKSRKRQAGVYKPREVPAHTSAGVGVQYGCQVTEGGGQPEVCDVRDPDLVEPVYAGVFEEVRVSLEGGSRIRGRHKATS